LPDYPVAEPITFAVFILCLGYVAAEKVFADERRLIAIEDRELQQKVHTANRGTFKRAFAQLREIGLIETQREATGHDGFGFYASKTVVRLTWGSEPFQSSLTAGESATQYIGSKLNHESDKKVNHGEEHRTVKKVNHGAGPEKSTASPQKVCGDLSSFTSCVGVGVRCAGQTYNFEAIRRELCRLFGCCEGSGNGWNERCGDKIQAGN